MTVFDKGFHRRLDHHNEYNTFVSQGGGGSLTRSCCRSEVTSGTAYTLARVCQVSEGIREAEGNVEYAGVISSRVGPPVRIITIGGLGCVILCCQLLMVARAPSVTKTVTAEFKYFVNAS